MAKWKYSRTRYARLWARFWLQRRTREIAIAVVLTVAAAGFITVAMLRGEPAGDHATHASARKAATR